jgi:hypothetical protein
MDLVRHMLKNAVSYFFRHATFEACYFLERSTFLHAVCKKGQSSPCSSLLPSPCVMCVRVFQFDCNCAYEKSPHHRPTSHVCLPECVDVCFTIMTLCTFTHLLAGEICFLLMCERLSAIRLLILGYLFMFSVSESLLQ